jgi:hypothetical protein
VDVAGNAADHHAMIALEDCCRVSLRQQVGTRLPRGACAVVWGFQSQMLLERFRPQGRFNVLACPRRPVAVAVLKMFRAAWHHVRSSKMGIFA